MLKKMVEHDTRVFQKTLWLLCKLRWLGHFIAPFLARRPGPEGAAARALLRGNCYNKPRR